jgi:hypothetical protein
VVLVQPYLSGWETLISEDPTSKNTVMVLNDVSGWRNIRIGERSTVQPTTGSMLAYWDGTAPGTLRLRNAADTADVDLSAHMLSLSGPGILGTSPGVNPTRGVDAAIAVQPSAAPSDLSERASGMIYVRSHAGFPDHGTLRYVSLGAPGQNAFDVNVLGWQLVERVYVDTNRQIVNFANLDPTNDEVYALMAYIVGSGSVNYRLRPEGATTNQGATEFKFSPNGSSGVTTYTDMRLATYGLGDRQTIFAVIHTKAGFARTYTSHSGGVSTISGSGGAGSLIGGWWSDTTTPIDNIEVWSSSSTGIRIGSVLSLFKPARV